MRRLTIALAIALFVSLFSTNAFACWDGHRIDAEAWSVMGGDESWDAEYAREFGAWRAPIERLLPADAEIEIEWDEVYVRSARFSYTGTFDGDFALLFDELVVATGASEAVVEHALAGTGHVYTVQISAGPSPDAAAALAEVVNDLDLDDVDPIGIYEAGGFPAMNPWAHVVPRERADGSSGSAVVVGVFASRADALAVRDVLASDHGLDGFVRYL